MELGKASDLSVAQQARITQNFQAAKARLEKKRQRADNVDLDCSARRQSARSCSTCSASRIQSAQSSIKSRASEAASPKAGVQFIMENRRVPLSTLNSNSCEQRAVQSWLKPCPRSGSSENMKQGAASHGAYSQEAVKEQSAAVSAEIGATETWKRMNNGDDSCSTVKGSKVVTVKPRVANKGGVDLVSTGEGTTSSDATAAPQIEMNVDSDEALFRKIDELCALRSERSEEAPALHHVTPLAQRDATLTKGGSTAGNGVKPLNWHSVGAKPKLGARRGSPASSVAEASSWHLSLGDENSCGNLHRHVNCQPHVKAGLDLPMSNTLLPSNLGLQECSLLLSPQPSLQDDSRATSFPGPSSWSPSMEIFTPGSNSSTLLTLPEKTSHHPPSSVVTPRVNTPRGYYSQENQRPGLDLIRSSPCGTRSNSLSASLGGTEKHCQTPLQQYDRWPEQFHISPAYQGQEALSRQEQLRCQGEEHKIQSREVRCGSHQQQGQPNMLRPYRLAHAIPCSSVEVQQYMPQIKQRVLPPDSQAVSGSFAASPFTSSRCRLSPSQQRPSSLSGCPFSSPTIGGSLVRERATPAIIPEPQHLLRAPSQSCGGESVAISLKCEKDTISLSREIEMLKTSSGSEQPVSSPTPCGPDLQPSGSQQQKILNRVSTARWSAGGTACTTSLGALSSQDTSLQSSRCQSTDPAVVRTLLPAPSSKPDGKTVIKAVFRGNNAAVLAIEDPIGSAHAATCSIQPTQLDTGLGGLMEASLEKGIDKKLTKTIPQPPCSIPCTATEASRGLYNQPSPVTGSSGVLQPYPLAGPLSSHSSGSALQNSERSDGTSVNSLPVCVLEAIKVGKAEDRNAVPVCTIPQKMSATDVRVENGLEDPPPAIAEAENTEATGSQFTLATTQEAAVHGLNDKQREAVVSDVNRPLVVLAGPGSGKTSTMVARLLHFIHKDIQPDSILAMTFTTAAAAEMRERVGRSVGKTVAAELTIATFHSFCLQLCRSHAAKLGRTEQFLVYGHSQQRKAVAEAVRLAAEEAARLPDKSAAPEDKQLSTEPGQRPGKAAGAEGGPSAKLHENPAVWKAKTKKWEQFVAQAKAAGRTPADFEKTGQQEKGKVLQLYEATLAACDALDYTDFITYALRLLSEFPEVLGECQQRWSHVLVDEFQDTSAEQYRFVSKLASHGCLTIVGDDDQSIFSFNGANSGGFDAFRADFPHHKEVRLERNYRSTACIVEAAGSLIRNNGRRHKIGKATTCNELGDKISVVECRNDAAQASWVVDSLVSMAAVAAGPGEKAAFGKFAILYRRQVTGRPLQAAFRARNIPFNLHGVAFYRKKLVRTAVAMLWTALPNSGDVHVRKVFKALFSSDRAEGKKAVEYIDRVAKGQGQGFLQTATEIFSAKVSGTYNRKQLGKGSKVVRVIQTLRRLMTQERSLSALVEAAVNLMPQRPGFNSRAVVDEVSGKLLNEDDDPRSVLTYLLDDVTDFLANQAVAPALDPAHNSSEPQDGAHAQLGEGSGGCGALLRAFLDHVAVREAQNFRTRRAENENSVALTTMHQSKGLEWDTVFVVKVNDSEVPLLHESSGFCPDEGSATLEEERRLFYVAMTRAKKRLFLCYVRHDEHRQILLESRFLRELPRHLLHWPGHAEPPHRGTSPLSAAASGTTGHPPSETRLQAQPMVASAAVGTGGEAGRSTSLGVKQGGAELPLLSCHGSEARQRLEGKGGERDRGIVGVNAGELAGGEAKVEGIRAEMAGGDMGVGGRAGGGEEADATWGAGSAGQQFLRRFPVEGRAPIAGIFHTWAQKAAFKEPRRLITKIRAVIDERLSNRSAKGNKEVLREARNALGEPDALTYAVHVLDWLKLPAEQRALFQAERQEHFQHQSSARAMAAAPPSEKQLEFLRKLGCTMRPSSKKEASDLIGHYKSL